MGNAGAGDQALVYGYATDETEERLPLSLVLAHRLARRLSELRRGAGSEWMRPDGKALVTLRGGQVDGVVLAFCLAPGLDEQKQEELNRLVQREVVEPALGPRMHDGVRSYLNPGGPFFEGGPAGDAGVTGRKLMVDAYGGLARHGGGGFSGKDGTKVDRSAAYFARWVARSVVDRGMARRAEVRLAYAIGREEPVVFAVDVLGTGDQRAAEQFLAQTDPRPAAIIDQFQLRRPIYRSTTQYGHFGKPELPWEQTGY
jgi:S-adenosylmethionine synthetase